MLMAMMMAAVIQTTAEPPQHTAQCYSEVATYYGEILALDDQDQLERIRTFVDEFHAARVRVIEARETVLINQATVLRAVANEVASGSLPSGSVEYQKEQYIRQNRDRDVEYDTLSNALVLLSPNCKWPGIPTELKTLP